MKSNFIEQHEVSELGREEKVASTLLQLPPDKNRRQTKENTWWIFFSAPVNFPFCTFCFRENWKIRFGFNKKKSLSLRFYIKEFVNQTFRTYLIGFTSWSLKKNLLIMFEWHHKGLKLAENDYQDVSFFFSSSCGAFTGRERFLSSSSPQSVNLVNF